VFDGPRLILLHVFRSDGKDEKSEGDGKDGKGKGGVDLDLDLPRLTGLPGGFKDDGQTVRHLVFLTAVLDLPTGQERTVVMDKSKGEPVISVKAKSKERVSVRIHHHLLHVAFSLLLDQLFKMG